MIVSFIESLSIGTGAIIIGILSAGFTFATAAVSSKITRWLRLLIFPLFVSYTLYWIPVWLGSGASGEYSSWAPLCIGVWSFVGFITSVIAMMVFQFIKKSRSRAHSEVK